MEGQQGIEDAGDHDEIEAINKENDIWTQDVEKDMRRRFRRGAQRMRGIKRSI